MDEHKRNAYDEFVAHTHAPIFLQSWWLDQVCQNGRWSYCAAVQEGTMLGIWPYYLSRFKGLKVNRMPALTPYLGPWISPAEGGRQNARQQQSREYAIYETMIPEMPVHCYFLQNFHPSVTNWLPFYWNNFRQTTRYTYVLEDLAEKERGYGSFSKEVRSRIRKAEGMYRLEESDDLITFYGLVEKSFQRQGERLTYSYSFLERLDRGLKARNCRQLILAIHPNGKAGGGVYTIWDGAYTYLLASGMDPQFGNTGVMQLLKWKAIEAAAARRLKFDFEGSMLRGVERLNRAFGAVPMPYFQLSKAPNRWIEALRVLWSRSS